MLNICLLRALPSPGSVLPGQSGMEHLWGLPVPALRSLSPDTAIAPGIQDCSQPHTWKVFPVPSCPSCCAHQTPPLGDKGQTGDTGKTACVLCPTWGDIRGYLSPAQSFIPHLMGAGKPSGMEKQQHSSAQLPMEPPGLELVPRGPERIQGVTQEMKLVQGDLKEARRSPGG